MQRDPECMTTKGSNPYPKDTPFLRGLRKITTDFGTLLIFDEVISGFRIGPGGAQQYYGVLPDLTCLGKIIGGGLPVGAYGGKREIMIHMAPEGNIYQAGTLSGNPIAMVAGMATLNALKNGQVYKDLEEKGDTFFNGLAKAAESAGLDVVVNHIGSMGTMFFTKDPVTDFTTAKKGNTELFKIYYREMLERGIMLAPSPFEATFISLAHTDEVIRKTVEYTENCLNTMSRSHA